MAGVEVGIPAGGPGVRDLATAVRVAKEVERCDDLSLRGVSGFEGLVPGNDSGKVPSGVPALLTSIRDVVNVLAAEGRFSDEQPIVSSGGSSFFDVVVDIVGPEAFDISVTTVLRSGCYVTHDHGL